MKKNNTHIKNFEQCLDPNNFLKLIDAVQELAKYDPDTGNVEVISISGRLKQCLQECAQLVHNNVVLNPMLKQYEKEEQKSKITDFLGLLKSNWKYKISTNSEKSRKRKRMRKPLIIPDNDDIVTVFKATEKSMLALYEELEKNTTPKNYVKLEKVLLIQIFVLNRRRPADVTVAELEDYLTLNSRDDFPSQEYAYLVLTEDQLESMDELSSFYVLGKRYRDVPCLLTKNMRKALDLLVIKRPDVRIAHNEPLLFINPITNNPFNGSNLMNDVKQKCLLKKPGFFTCTGLRHEVATISQISVTDSTAPIEHLATHMGHDLAIHKQNYRLPLDIIEKGQVGHQLLTMARGTFFKNTEKISDAKKKKTKSS